MWAKPVDDPSAASAANPAWRMGAYSGPSMSRGRTTHHWIQSVRRTSSGPGR
ncbi:MAG: hypothetical protein ABIP29_07800 [Candidatus Eisenbacteria bacterium]